MQKFHWVYSLFAAAFAAVLLVGYAWHSVCELDCFGLNGARVNSSITGGACKSYLQLARCSQTPQCWDKAIANCGNLGVPCATACSGNFVYFVNATSLQNTGYRETSKEIVINCGFKCAIGTGGLCVLPAGSTYCQCDSVNGCTPTDTGCGKVYNELEECPVNNG